MMRWIGWAAMVMAWVGVAGAAQPQKHVLFLVGEPEYGMERSFPAFAKTELEPRGWRCTVIVADKKDPNEFKGLEKVKDIDLIVLGVRRRTPPVEQMAVVRQHLEAGRPLVGVKVASHAFGATPPDARHEAWPTFDVDVLGAHYEGHFGAGLKTRVTPAAGAKEHPILRGLPAEGFTVPSKLYRSRNLAKSTTTLLWGALEGKAEREPVAWTNTYKGGRVFYTSMGSEEDFEVPAFRKMLVNGVLWAMDIK